MHVDAACAALDMTVQPPEGFTNVRAVKVSAEDGSLFRGTTSKVGRALTEE